MANIRPTTGNGLAFAYFKKVVAGTRTYDFAIKTNRAGRQYLSITETGSNDSSEVCTRLVVFQQHLEVFHKAYLKAAKRLEPKLKVFDVDKIRENYPNAFKLWTPEDDVKLASQFRQGLETVELAKLFQRQPGGIKRRLRRLGLI